MTSGGCALAAEPFGAGRRLDELAVFGREGPAQEAPHLRLVLDDEDREELATLATFATVASLASFASSASHVSLARPRAILPRRSLPARAPAFVARGWVRIGDGSRSRPAHRVALALALAPLGLRFARLPFERAGREPRHRPRRHWVGLAAAARAFAARRRSPVQARRPFRVRPEQAGAASPLPPRLRRERGWARGRSVGGRAARPRAEAFVAHPDGTPDRADRRFWSATDACCDFGGANVDDVAYLTAVIDDVAARYAIDPKRVWVAGISNGGFMAHRLACERADKIAAIVSFAGATWADPARCAPTAPVSVLEVHGAADPVVRYEGGASLPGGRERPPTLPSMRPSRRARRKTPAPALSSPTARGAASTQTTRRRKPRSRASPAAPPGSTSRAGRGPTRRTFRPSRPPGAAPSWRGSRATRGRSPDPRVSARPTRAARRRRGAPPSIASPSRSASARSGGRRRRIPRAHRARASGTRRA